MVKYPISGSCQCGQVTYTLREPPIAVAACHCIQCQKLSASAFSITAMVQSDAFEVIRELSEWRELPQAAIQRSQSSAQDVAVTSITSTRRILTKSC